MTQSGHRRNSRLLLTSYKSPLRDFTSVRQFPQELHLGTDRAERIGIELENAQRVVRQLFIDHFEIEIDIGGKAPYILCARWGSS
jgi:hypothetical protein